MLLNVKLVQAGFLFFSLPFLLIIYYGIFVGS